MKLTVNGEPVELAEGRSLLALLNQLGKSAQRGIAVAANGAVVSSANWEAHLLSEGDDVLIIQAAQGG